MQVRACLLVRQFATSLDEAFCRATLGLEVARVLLLLALLKDFIGLFSGSCGFHEHAHA